MIAIDDQPVHESLHKPQNLGHDFVKVELFFDKTGRPVNCKILQLGGSAKAKNGKMVCRGYMTINYARDASVQKRLGEAYSRILVAPLSPTRD